MNSSERGVRASMGYAVCAVLVIAVALGWHLWPRKVTLPADSYDFAIALYRVCNQQDEQGLRQLQQKLDELNAIASPTETAMAMAHLQQIIDQAESGNWDLAMRQTRSALADQTR